MEERRGSIFLVLLSLESFVTNLLRLESSVQTISTRICTGTATAVAAAAAQRQVETVAFYF